MTVTFIVAYHNEPLWMLKECLNSILSLRIPKDKREIILVDDGSDVSPLTYIDAERNGIIYVRQENKGLSEARNTALRCASGDYVQFVDSDDYLLADEYCKLLEQIRAEDLDLLMFRFTHGKVPVDKDSDNGGLSVVDGATYLCRNNLRGAACLYVFRRDILHGLEFKPGICHEDMLFTPLLILNASKVLDTNSVAYFYRLHSGTIMSNRNSSHIRKRLDDSVTILEVLKKEMERSTGQRFKALRRVVDQQVMVYVYSIVTMQPLLRLPVELHRRISKLRCRNLYPVSLCPYTLKYYVFAILSRIIR